jgi:two-component system chemotaxis response regulator CheB
MLSENLREDMASRENGEKPNSPAPITCPECGGVLWELDERALIQYQCHVGHTYSPESMMEGVAHRIEQNMWTLLRSLREGSSLQRRLAVYLRAHDDPVRAEKLERFAEANTARAEAVLRMIEHQDSTGDGTFDTLRGTPQDPPEGRDP